MEVLVLSFLVLACAASALAYRALAQNRAALGAELTAAYLAQQQLAYIEAQYSPHGTSSQPGSDLLQIERNGTQFEIVSSALPHPETGTLAVAEVRVRWQANGKLREKPYRKFVTAP